MSTNRLQFHGLKELMDALRKLPQELADEAAGIVGGAAESSQTEIQAEYVVGPVGDEHRGDLKSKVSVRKERSRFGASATVTSKSKHALPYEYGTQVRKNQVGANRGAMPAKPTVVPIVNRNRHAMYGKLADLLKRNGLQVTGDAS